MEGQLPQPTANTMATMPNVPIMAAPAQAMPAAAQSSLRHLLPYYSKGILGILETTQEAFV